VTLRGSGTPCAGLAGKRRSLTAPSRMAASTPQARKTVVALFVAPNMVAHAATAVWRMLVMPVDPQFGRSCALYPDSSERYADGLKWPC